MIGNAGVSNGGSTDVVNGIIEQYKAQTETIDANTFVEFVNNININISAGDSQILDSSSNGTSPVSCVKMSDNTVFLTIAYGTSSYLYGLVCTISDTTVATGTMTQISISSTKALSYVSKVVRLSSTRVFIVTGYSNTAYGVLCTISGTAITVNTTKQISTNTYSCRDGYGPNVVLLSYSKVLVCYPYNSSYYLYGSVCTISGTTITVGSSTAINAISNTGINPSLLYQSETEAVVISEGSSSNAIVCTISGTTITVGEKQTVPNGDNTEVFYIKPNKFVLIGTPNSSGNYMYGLVGNIDNDIITVKSNTHLIDSTHIAANLGGALINNNKIFLAHSYGENYYLYGTIITIDGDNLIYNNNVMLCNYSNFAKYRLTSCMCNNTNAFVGCRSSGNHVYSIICGFEDDIVKVQPSITKTEGLTKTEVTTETEGDIWVLDTEVSV